MYESKKKKKDQKKISKSNAYTALPDIVTEQSLEKNYKILGKVIFWTITM